MKALKLTLLAAVSVLALLPGSSRAQTSVIAPSSDWKAVVQSRLPLYGHRNWIVVADSAFPAYAEPGIETIVADEDMPSVLKYVAGAISSSRHVRATVFLDEELQYVDEHDYPGVTELRRQIAATFAKNRVSSMPHAEVMAKIDDAGKIFRILFIKTTATIPYTSVFM
ncbi:MAG: RbsD/FucU domain-containing protein, partial [Candidatus Sulfotelmatobacter sp.]